MKSNLDLPITVSFYRKSNPKEHYSLSQFADFETFRIGMNTANALSDMMETQSNVYEIRTSISVKNKTFDCYLVDAISETLLKITA